MGLRETVLSRRQRRYSHIEIDGEKVCLQSLTQAETTRVGLVAIDANGKPLIGKMDEMRAKTLCLSLVDEETKQPLFEESEWSLLTEIDPDTFGKLYEAAEALNLGNNASLEQDALKNLEPATV